MERQAGETNPAKLSKGTEDSKKGLPGLPSSQPSLPQHGETILNGSTVNLEAWFLSSDRVWGTSMSLSVNEWVRLEEP